MPENFRNQRVLFGAYPRSSIIQNIHAILNYYENWPAATMAFAIISFINTCIYS